MLSSSATSVDDHAHKNHTFSSLIETKEYDTQRAEGNGPSYARKNTQRDCTAYGIHSITRLSHFLTRHCNRYFQALHSPSFSSHRLLNVSYFLWGLCSSFSSQCCMIFIFFYFARSIVLHLFSLRTLHFSNCFFPPGTPALIFFFQSSG